MHAGKTRALRQITATQQLRHTLPSSTHSRFEASRSESPPRYLHKVSSAANIVWANLGTIRAAELRAQNLAAAEGICLPPRCATSSLDQQAHMQ